MDQCIKGNSVVVKTIEQVERLVVNNAISRITPLFFVHVQLMGVLHAR